MRKKFQTILTKSAIVVATLLLCLSALEVSLRVLDRYPTGSMEGHLRQAAVGYRLRTNCTRVVQWPTMHFTVYTDDHGFRFKKPGPRVIGARPYYAALGSSEVFANGLDYEQSFIGVLADHLEPRGLDMVNMGIPGQAFMEQSLQFQEFTRSSGALPKKVLIFLNPILIGEYDNMHENVVVRRGELFLKDHWRLPLLKLILSRSSTAYCFFRDTIRNSQVRYLPAKDVSASYYIEKYSTDLPIHRPEKTADFLKRLKELEDYVRSLNATPVCIYNPTVGGFLLDKLKAEGKIDGRLFDTQFFSRLAQKHCEEEGIQFINVEPFLQKKYDKGEKLNFDLDSHFNAATSRAVGDFIYQALEPDAKDHKG
jgi:hypothetical protein